MIDQHKQLFLENIESKLPKTELLTPDDLLKAGIAKNISTITSWRVKKQGPRFIKIAPRMINYLRTEVLTWLKERIDLT